MIPVVLSGGAGSRLWPVSRQSFPKQFCEFLEESLFTKTLQRLKPLGSPWVVTVRGLKTLTERELRANGIPVEQAVYEPMGRNTAAAVALVCRVFELHGWTSEVAGFFPADQLIRDEGVFHAAVSRAAEIAAGGEIVTLGIEPTGPATGYGYIETAGAVGAGLKAIAFREKPSVEKAQEFLARGGFFWNAGMFIFKVQTMIEAFRAHAPDVWAVVSELRADQSNIEDIYARVRAISIDYAVMEKLPSHVCIPCRSDWSDLGSWDSIAEVFSALPTAEEYKPTIEVDAARNFVMPSADRAYAFVGVSDLIVVDSPDALLVTKRGETEKVKEVVDRLKSQGDKRAGEHSFEVRPWGRFEILRDTPDFKSKVLVVEAGQRISYQSHAKRSEHWIVVEGKGEVLLDGKVIPVGKGSHVEIPIGAKHQLRAAADADLRIVEVQLGTYFGEDDIVRYEDAYGRA